MTTLSREPAIESPIRRGSDFSALSRQVCAARLLDRRYWHYTLRIAVTLLACAAAWAGLVLLSGSWFELLVAAGLEPFVAGPYLRFEHRVDQTIVRDVIVARKG